MTLCDDGHEEIVFQVSKSCPLCDAIFERDDLEGQLEELTLDCEKLKAGE
jgi:hypothetical protein